MKQNKLKKKIIQYCHLSVIVMRSRLKSKKKCVENLKKVWSIHSVFKIKHHFEN